MAHPSRHTSLHRGGEFVPAAPAPRVLGVDTTKTINAYKKKSAPAVAGTTDLSNATNSLATVRLRSVAQALEKQTLSPTGAAESPQKAAEVSPQGYAGQHPSGRGSVPPSHIGSPNWSAVDSGKAGMCPVMHDSASQYGGSSHAGPGHHGRPPAGASEHRPTCPVMNLGDMEAHSTVRKETNNLNWHFLEANGIFPFHGSEKEHREGIMASAASVAPGANSHLFSPASSHGGGGGPHSHTSHHSPLPPWCSSKEELAGVVQDDGVYITPTGWHIYPPPDLVSPMVTPSHSHMSTPTRLLTAIHRVHNIHVNEHKPRLMFNAMLSILLEVTESSYGFIASVHHDDDHSIYMKVQAITNITWTPDLLGWYKRTAPHGLVHNNLKSLFGEVLATQKPVISNDPANDPRSGGLPEGHPALNYFMGMPLIAGGLAGGEFIGVFGLANREGGFTHKLGLEIEPLTQTMADIVYAFAQRQKRLDTELHLFSIIQAADEGIMTLKKNGHITSMNTAACGMFGFSTACVTVECPGGLPRPPANLQFGDLVIAVGGQEDFMHAGLDELVNQHKNATGLRADGSIVPIEIAVTKTAKGFFGEDETYVAVIHDICEKLEAEARLKESEERWLYALSGSDDGVWDWSVPDNGMFFSDRWKSMLGYEGGDIGSTLDDWIRLLHPDDREKTFEDLEEHLEGKTKQYVNEQRLLCKDGEYRWFLHRGKLISVTEEGHPLRFVGTHTDISQLQS
eukprot:jgi/Mesen1/4016/ME000211S03197